MHFAQPEGLPEPHAARPFFDDLTKERSRIVAHVALGLTNKQIKETTCRSFHTVKNSQQQAAASMGVRGDRISLTALAHASGWYQEVGNDFIDTKPRYNSARFERGLSRLTKGQFAVLELRVSGMTIEEEAVALGIAPKTVRNRYQDIIIRFDQASAEPGPLSMHAIVSGVWLDGLIEVAPAIDLPNISRVA